MTVTVSVPPAVLTLTAPAPAASREIRVRVPPARLRMGAPVPYVSGSGTSMGGSTGPVPGGSAFLRLWIGGLEVGAFDWSMTGEEVLGSVGRGILGVQDRANTDWEPRAHDDVRITIRDTGWVLFRGEIMTAALDLPPGMDFRWWKCQCRDYNGATGERLLGAPDGFNFWRPNGLEEYRPVDPNAINGAHDDGTIRDWVSHYLFIAGGVIDTSTHVHQYATDLGDPEREMVLYDSMTTLASAVASLAQLLEVNVQDWIDPDLQWHHVAIPSAVDLLDSGDPGDLAAAPAAIGPSGAGAMSLSATWDGQTMPEQLYAQGATTFVLDKSAIGIPGVGGSGWFPLDPDFPDVPAGQNPTKRQAYLSIPGSWSRGQSVRVTDSALRRATQETLRGSVRIQGVDEWRAGQVVTIEDSRLPPSLQGSHLFVIQRVSWSLYPGNDVREYVLEFGDGPVSRANTGGQKPQPPDPSPEKRVKKPVIAYRMEWQNAEGNVDANPIGPGEVRYAVADTANALGESHQPAGVPIHFRIVAVDADPDSPTFGSIIAGQGSFSPADTVTDQDGKARSVFTAGDREGLAYSPYAETELPS